jgi:hypothetical protein
MEDTLNITDSVYQLRILMLINIKGTEMIN